MNIFNLPPVLRATMFLLDYLRRNDDVGACLSDVASAAMSFYERLLTEARENYAARGKWIGIH